MFSVPSLVLTILLALLSLFMTLAQPLFQISIATGYDDELEQCKDAYSVYSVYSVCCVRVCCVHMRLLCVRV